MKLNSKSGATLAAAAATLFLAGSVVSTVSTPANAAQGAPVTGPLALLKLWREDLARGRHWF